MASDKEHCSAFFSHSASERKTAEMILHWQLEVPQFFHSWILNFAQREQQINLYLIIITWYQVLVNVVNVNFFISKIPSIEICHDTKLRE